MKRNNLFSCAQISISMAVILFFLVQLLMIIASVFFSGGGHGTGIPLIIFYGPLLTLFQFKIFENSLISFVVLFLIFIGLFALAYYKVFSKKILKILCISYISISISILFYTEINGWGQGMNLALWIKLLALLISVIISSAFWAILFFVNSIRKGDSSSQTI